MQLVEVEQLEGWLGRKGRDESNVGKRAGS
jgi:hypothetical protein